MAREQSLKIETVTVGDRVSVLKGAQELSRRKKGTVIFRVLQTI